MRNNAATKPWNTFKKRKQKENNKKNPLRLCVFVCVANRKEGKTRSFPHNFSEIIVSLHVVCIVWWLLFVIVTSIYKRLPWTSALLLSLERVLWKHNLRCHQDYQNSCSDGIKSRALSAFRNNLFSYLNSLKNEANLKIKRYTKATLNLVISENESLWTASMVTTSNFRYQIFKNQFKVLSKKNLSFERIF